jgi:hypothetical protein
VSESGHFGDSKKKTGRGGRVNVIRRLGFCYHVEAGRSMVMGCGAVLEEGPLFT